MSELVSINIGSIDPNPFRMLGTYPFRQDKIDILKRSIADVGLWEGVIGRRKDNRVELAFGHQRVEAGRQLGLTMIAVILRDLTDEQMLQFMGRENLEDYNKDFLVMLESWEAAVKFSNKIERSTQAVDIARLLGWMRPMNEGRNEQMTPTARACHAAAALIIGGHLNRNDLAGIGVKAALEIVERAQSRIEMLEALGSKGKRPRNEIETDKRYVAGAARSVAKGVREGNILQKDIRGEVDFRAVKTAADDKRQSPLFADFAKKVAEDIHRMLVDDKTAEKLAEMEKALPIVSMEEDHKALRRIDFALAEHEHTTGRWRERLTPQGKKVVPFKLLKKGGE